MGNRALVIGSQTSGLTGVESDARGVAEMLGARGFTVDLRLQGQATRQGILDGYDALIAQTGNGDAAVVYYSGHGSRAIDSRSGSGDTLQDIVPFDYFDGSDLDYRGISSLELSIKLHQLVQRSRNTTVILDCCHSGQMSRDGAVHDATPRTLSHPLRADLAAHRSALKALYGDALKALGTTGNPDAVRLVACAQTEVAMEYTNARGRRTGAFTEALLELLHEILAGPVSGFLDIALFSSHDAGGPALADLLAASADIAAREEVATALRAAAPSQVAVALGASAVITRQVHDVLRAAIGAPRCLYHASFLAENDLGLGRHPALDTYRSPELSFAVSIEAANG